MATREDVVREALSWVGTPYVARQMVKGAGCDCAGLLCSVFAAVGALPADTTPTGLAGDAYPVMQSNDGLYMRFVRQHCDQVDRPEPGDVSMFLFDNCAHSGLWVSATQFVHASSRDEHVCVATWNDYWWAKHLIGHYRLKGLG